MYRLLQPHHQSRWQVSEDEAIRMQNKGLRFLQEAPATDTITLELPNGILFAPGTPKLFKRSGNYVLRMSVVGVPAQYMKDRLVP